MYRVFMTYMPDPEQKPVILHDPRDTDASRHLVNPRVVRKANSVHTLEFTIRQEHPWFDDIKEFKSDIWVEDWNDLENIFKGRVIQAIPTVTEDGEYIKEVLCEDAMGWLNDSYQKFNKIDVKTVREFIEKLLAYHNDRFGQKQIFLGECEPIFPVKVVTQYEKTIDLLFRETVEKHGGYLEIEYAKNGKVFLHYRQGIKSTHPQPCIIGTNLLSMRMTVDYTKIANKFTPLGAEIPPPEQKPGEKPPENQSEWETARPRVQIRYKNPGFDDYRDYIYDQESVNQVGEIEGIKFYDDITDPKKLLDAGLKDFQGMNIPERKVELTALDLYELGYYEFKKWELRDSIRIICYDLGIDEAFVLSEIDLPIDAPESATFHFGNFSETSMVNRFSSVGDRITGLNVKMNGIQYSGQIKLDDVVDKHVELANEMTEKTNDMIKDIDAVTGDLGVYKVETDKMLATKVADSEFKSYQIQVAGQLSSKVEGHEFESYRMQTDRAIADRVKGSEFESYKVQTDYAISQMVKGTEFQSYVAQTDSKIAMVVQDNGRVNSASIALAISEDESSLQLIADRIEIKPHSGVIEFPNGTDIDTRDSSGHNRPNHIRLRADRYNYIMVNQDGFQVFQHDGSGGTTSAFRVSKEGTFVYGRKVKWTYE